MKKIELTSGLKFILIVLTWLVTFTVTNVSGLISGAGTLIGLLVFYAAILFADFAYFNDKCLQKHAKMSLVVIVIVIICQLFINCYGLGIDYFTVNASAKTLKNAQNVESIINGIFFILRNITVAVALIMVLVKTKDCCKCNDATEKNNCEVKEEANTSNEE